LDNGFRACDQAERLAGICDSRSEQDIQQFSDRWLRLLPSPFTAAERGRYRYRLSVRQMETSDTRVFDRPAAGRAWFEQTIRGQLGLGRPDKVQIIFDRKVTRRTPAGSKPRSSPQASSRSSRRTTSTARSSSTAKKAARSEPRRPSTTPTTSPSTAR